LITGCFVVVNKKIKNFTRINVVFDSLISMLTLRVGFVYHCAGAGGKSQRLTSSCSSEWYLASDRYLLA